MNTHADETQKNKSQSVSNGESQMQSGGESTFQFVDNRPEAAAQRKLLEMANNSPQTMQMKAFQDMANNSPQAKQAAQLQAMAGNNSARQGVEDLAGYAMDDVKVRRSVDKPARLQAQAYAQGTDIHLGPGQGKHLAHEAWHVVQQKLGRVKLTVQMKGEVNVNDDAGLEKEADIMGAKAASVGQMVLQKKEKERGIKFGIDGPTKSIERATPSFSPSLLSIQRIGEPTVQRKRERDKDEDKADVSQLRQFKKSPIQRYSKVIQLAIGSPEEAPPGTRIMVVNPVAQDTGDLGTVIRPSTVKGNCMAVEFDNEPRVYYRVYFNEMNVITKPKEDQLDEPQVPESKILKSMLDNAITAAALANAELNEVMSADKTNAHGGILPPEAQLEKCLIDCKDLSAEETAQYMYTTYFYGPLNKYLRNPEVRLASDVIQELIDIVHAFLTRVFNKTPAAPLVPKFRMELQAEWIDKPAPKEVDDDLSFKAFTSTHPELAGVNGMWPDIENGSFGDVTKLALLVFQGTSKFLYPDKKYFPNEYEHILLPGMKTKIGKKYEIKWTDESKAIDDPKREWIVTVFHLTIEGSGDVADFKLGFDEGGNIIAL